MDRFSLLAAVLHKENHSEFCCRSRRSPVAPFDFVCDWQYEEDLAVSRATPVDWEKGEHGHHYTLARKIHNAVKDIWK